MPFTLVVDYTENGERQTLRLPDQLDEVLGETQEMIASFTARRWPANGRLIIHDPHSGTEKWRRRWADIKDIRIEKC